MKIEIKNFIGGQFVPPVSGEYFDNFNPATGKVYSQIPDSQAVDMVQAIAAANKAYLTWSKTSLNQRTEIFYRIVDLMKKKSKELALAESIDIGKPINLSSSVDIPRSILNFQFFADHMLAYKNPEIIKTTNQSNEKTTSYISRHSLGVAGLITSWNLPLYLLTWKIAPAIITGNTCVAKPSEFSPMTAFLLSEILQEAGLPEGVVNIVHGRGSSTGETLVSHPSVPLISFTGGTSTGEKIQTMAAPFFKKTSLELGGKNPNIILKDADLEKALDSTLRSSFLNSGQICLTGSRLFVQKDIYNEFISEFKNRTRNLVVGDPLDEKTFMGPVISKEALKRINSCIEQAKKEGGEVSVGEEALNLKPQNKEGYFMGPTIIEELTDCSDLWQKEIFGPLVTVRSFKYAHEAVKWSNISPYGLSASIWTSNLERAQDMALKIQAGTIWINDWARRSPEIPFGGMKSSGIGREGGDHSIDFYTELQVILSSED